MRMTGSKLAVYCAALRGGTAAAKECGKTLKQVRRINDMMNKKLTKALLAIAGAGAVAGFAFAAGVAAGLKKWANDEDSDSIKVALGGKKGLAILKGEKPGTFTVDTRYDWQNDPEFADILDEDEDIEDEELEDEELEDEDADGEDPGIEVEIEIKPETEAPQE